MTRRTSDHIVLSSHPSAQGRGPFYPIEWGAPTATERGPVIASLTDMASRNAIGRPLLHSADAMPVKSPASIAGVGAN